MNLRFDRFWIKRIAAGLLLFALIFALNDAGAAYASVRKSITTKEDLNHEWIRIGVGEGGAAEQIVEKELPKAKRMYMGATDGYQSVAQGKIDAYIFERDQMQLAIDSGRTGVRLLDENMDESVHVAVGISKASQIDGLEGKMNAFIEEKKADGTLDDMYDRWVVRDDETFPDIDLPKNPSYHLTVGTTGIVPPFSYYKDSKLNGYDIELAYRFASWMDADLEFKVYDYSGVVAAALSGDVDCVMAELNVTPERAESLIFSEDLFELPVGIMVRDDTAAVPEYQTFEELGGKTFSMLTGAPFEELVRSMVPDAGNFTFYNNISDMLLALKSGKTDAVLCNNAVSQLAVNRNPDLALFPEDLKEGVFGFAFAKGNPECDKWQAAFDSISEETVNRAWSKWTGSDESKKVLPVQDWPGKNGTLRVAACDTVEPMSYIGKNGELIGFDIEMILMMAKELDVHVEFIPLEFSAVLSYIQSGKADMGNGSIIVTDERKEAMDFVEYFPAAFVLIVRADDDADGYAGFLESIKEGFEKNFIREDRWKLFLQGIITTLVITVMSVVLGTALGFAVFLICKDGNPVANTVTNITLRLIQGMPIVVLLMILYYIIFGSISISGVIVSIIAFSLTFGSSVYGLLRMGIGAVDRGQYEAAYALGYTVNHTFFRIILPQALPHMMNSYRGEIVGLIKATAIVGYIAVQDLTKVGDIVRSRTYEAFFPLIAIAVIYFALEGLFGFLVKHIHIKIDTRKRKREWILKGVDLHDKD